MPKQHINHRPLSNIAQRKGKSSQLGNLVNGWATSLMTPQEKALHKAKGRQEKKIKSNE